jgi:hypothetical protein
VRFHSKTFTLLVLLCISFALNGSGFLHDHPFGAAAAKHCSACLFGQTVKSSNVPLSGIELAKPWFEVVSYSILSEFFDSIFSEAASGRSPPKLS